MARPSGIAFRLSQLGAHVSTRFSERLAELGLTPEHVGVLRVVGQQPGLSQQALATRMGALPSRIVHLVDELEEMGLVARRRSTGDRRTYELHTADDAGDRLARVLDVIRDHDDEVTRVLTEDEKQTLAELLGRIAADQGLNQQAHPAYGRKRVRRRGETTVPG